MNTFTAYLDPTLQVQWSDTDNVLDSARTYGCIRIVGEESGEEEGVALHTEILGWAPAAYDSALREAGWRRTGDWRYQLLCAVEPACSQ